jgi:hypothetical protein
MDNVVIVHFMTGMAVAMFFTDLYFVGVSGGGGRRGQIEVLV